MRWPRGQQQHLEQQLGAVEGRKVKITTSYGKCPYPVYTTDLPQLPKQMEGQHLAISLPPQQSNHESPS